MNLANSITLCRLFSVPVAVWLMTFAESAAFWLFVAAGLSDAVDGFVAKRFGQASEIGKYLDPLADKALLVSVFVVLAIQGQVPNWVAIVVVSRDVLIVGGLILSFAIALPVRMRPFAISKVNTGAQIILAGTALARAAYGWEVDAIVSVLEYAVGLTTVASGAAYVVHWTKLAAKAESAR
ncbi:MAG: CDP-alcohol phosphatidyltransferase family protein [Alphaproteobacteria bacterium]|nr:CDP-alcohol phosphatidyltransferase family protein [Alphaproteobacteria bacterium]